MNLNEFKDALSRAAFGMTKAEAHKQCICISCKKPIVLNSEKEAAEYRISGLCGECYDKAMKEPDEDSTAT